MKTQLAYYKGHTSTLWDVQFSPFGLYFLSGAADGMMALWKTDCPTPVRLLKHGLDVYKVSFAKNPTFGMSAGENCEVRIWNIEKAELVRVFFIAVRLSTLQLQWLTLQQDTQDNTSFLCKLMVGYLFTTFLTTAWLYHFSFIHKNKASSSITRRLLSMLPFQRMKVRLLAWQTNMQSCIRWKL